MVGAYYGRSGLPVSMVQKVLKCDLSLGGEEARPVEVLPSASYITRFEKMFLKIPR
jgi:hypothetical protein